MKPTLVVCAVLFFLVSCSKESDSPAGPNNGSIHSSANLAFSIGQDSVSVAAKWKTLPNNRYRIYWEETAGGTYRNIEIDLYGNTPGSYAVQSSADSAGEAGFQYYIQNGANYVGEKGVVVLTGTANDAWSGTFALTVKNGSTGAEVRNGVFSDVPRE